MSGEDFGIQEGYGDTVQEAMEGPGVWIHVPARGVLTICLLREKPVRYEAHWVNGRVRPCPGTGRCNLCANQVGKKVRYVYSVFETKGRTAGLVEVSPGTATDIMHACADAGFARGLTFTVRKEGGVANGRLIAQSMHSMLAGKDLPDGPDPAHVLRRQWSLPEADVVTPETAAIRAFRPPDASDFAVRAAARSEERRKSTEL